MGFHFYLSMITIESDQPELRRALESLVEEAEREGGWFSEGAAASFFLFPIKYQKSPDSQMEDSIPPYFINCAIR
jgi:hypothetical protein